MNKELKEKDGVYYLKGYNYSFFMGDFEIIRFDDVPTKPPPLWRRILMRVLLGWDVKVRE